MMLPLYKDRRIGRIVRKKTGRLSQPAGRPLKNRVYWRTQRIEWPLARLAYGSVIFTCPS